MCKEFTYSILINIFKSCFAITTFIKRICKTKQWMLIRAVVKSCSLSVRAPHSSSSRTPVHYMTDIIGSTTLMGQVYKDLRLYQSIRKLIKLYLLHLPGTVLLVSTHKHLEIIREQRRWRLTSLIGGGTS